jgi:hypothetical protein
MRSRFGETGPCVVAEGLEDDMRGRKAGHGLVDFSSLRKVCFDHMENSDHDGDYHVYLAWSWVL